jgi:hypothetical protein
VKIRMYTIAAGPGVSYAKDQELRVGKDITTALARTFVSSGFAEVTEGRPFPTPVPVPIEEVEA